MNGIKAIINILITVFIYYLQSFVLILHNGHVYEMFGNSKHYSVQQPLLYKPAEMTNKPLTAKYFIYDVVVWPLFYSVLALPFTFREAIIPEFTAKIATLSGLYPFLMNLAIRMQTFVSVKSWLYISANQYFIRVAKQSLRNPLFDAGHCLR
ncbi:hypothetical protein [Geofilum rhodophaeum]|uniref:hypothetical protein n=1 Tax=Geofilum rhodophaeum TaxID=1965019 RepID=UPI000B527D45|nr:hypothetical protein [Geofilum rhodophaeum]